MSNLELVKEIRQLTGAGMSDVNKALREADGDKEKAIEALRKKGQQMAAKKSDRETSEGVIAIAKGDGKIAVVGLRCETDFVARNEDFIKSTQNLADQLLALGKEKFETWATNHIQNELIVKIGENLQLADFDVFTGDVIGSYLHSNNKVAAIVVLKGGDEALANEISMHTAAMSPRYLKPEDVEPEVLAKEKEIYTEQLKGEGKPVEMIEKIMGGKVAKFYTEVCLLKQAYVKEDKKSIEQLVAENNATIEDYKYLSL